MDGWGLRLFLAHGHLSYNIEGMIEFPKLITNLLLQYSVTLKPLEEEVNMILVLVAKKCMPILWIVKTLTRHESQPHSVSSHFPREIRVIYYKSDLGLLEPSKCFVVML